MKYPFNFKQDIETVLESKHITLEEFCKIAKVSKRTVLYSYKNEPSQTTLDKVYSAIFNLNIRLNKTKSEIFDELFKTEKQCVLYHGSKLGVEKFSKNGSKETNDFGSRLYLTELIDSATSFVETYSDSTIYAFKANFDGLKICNLSCDLNWMIAVSYYRGKLDKYKNHPIIKQIITQIESSDVVIAPIADNKMFDILNQFAAELLTTEQAIHCLSASRLGKQVVIISDKALNRLSFIERMYLCKEEKELSQSNSFERSLQIQTKLDYAKRNFRNKGQYIDEVLK